MMAWKDLLSNLPSSVGGVISAGINYFSNRAANRENVALAQMQNQWNIDQWNRENFYNRPDQQMARLKAAGLNPNLVFANGDMMNEAASSPQMTSGAGMVRPYQIDPLTAAQIANINADTAQKKSKTETENVTREALLENLQANTASLQKSIDVMKSQEWVNESQALLNNDLAGKARSEALEHQENYRYLSRALDKRLQLLDHMVSKADYDQQKAAKELPFVEDHIRSLIDNLKASSQLFRANALAAPRFAAAAEAQAAASQQNANTYSVDSARDYEVAWGQIEAKLLEISAQIERWDAMTVNERIKLASEVTEQLVELGLNIYTKGGYAASKTVSETFTTKTDSHGRKSTVHTVNRSRKPKGM